VWESPSGNWVQATTVIEAASRDSSGDRLLLLGPTDTQCQAYLPGGDACDVDQISGPNEQERLVDNDTDVRAAFTKYLALPGLAWVIGKPTVRLLCF